MRIDRLSKFEVPAVLALLRTINRDFFDGLPIDETALASDFASARRDRYWGIWKDADLSAVFFLRGLDSGFMAPAFGVAVAPAAQGRGIGRLALIFAETWSRNAGLSDIMLTVHPDNARAISLYEAHGFLRTNEFSPKGNIVFRKSL